MDEVPPGRAQSVQLARPDTAAVRGRCRGAVLPRQPARQAGARTHIATCPCVWITRAEDEPVAGTDWPITDAHGATERLRNVRMLQEIRHCEGAAQDRRRRQPLTNRGRN